MSRIHTLQFLHPELHRIDGVTPEPVGKFEEALAWLSVAIPMDNDDAERPAPRLRRSFV